nr:hypothetical protein [Corynebacterium liangguodongii]
MPAFHGQAAELDAALDRVTNDVVVGNNADLGLGVIVFVESRDLFPFLPGDSLLITAFLGDQVGFPPRSCPSSSAGRASGSILPAPSPLGGT